jgi:nucleoside-diphosphate-sugar epimerase
MIAVIGASGYIGRHLVTELAQENDCRVRVLSRTQTGRTMGTAWPTGVEVIQGDLHDPESLQELLEAGCIVINLAYLWGAGEAENLALTRNLLHACKLIRVRRLIHCSTAAVTGRAPYDRVTEKTECRPITEYGITKLKLEQVIVSTAKGFFDTAILRPTSVFGPDGEPLKKLANDLVGGNRFLNYLKSCLFDFRRMNLVHIANVVAAILFLMRCKENLDGEIYIVSDDGAVANNFVDVERILMSSLNCRGYAFPRITLPVGLLGLLLRLLGRNNINPKCNYAQDKLERLGFTSPVVFEGGLKEYADWYRSAYLVGHGNEAE